MLEASITQRLQTLEQQLNRCWLGHPEVVEALQLCWMAKQHLMLYGAPGEGKTHVVKLLAKALAGTTLFDIVLGPSTRPSDVFGDVSLAIWKQTDRVKYLTAGMAPAVNFLVLDEVGKADSRLLLGPLMGIINERTFRNGDTLDVCPLDTCIGMSNEIPNDDAGGPSIRPFLDRFAQWFWLDPEPDDTLWVKVVTGAFEPAPTVELSRLEVQLVQAETQRVWRLFEQMPDPSVVEALTNLRAALREAGFTPSKRLGRWLMSLAAASAVRRGSDTILPEDLVVFANSVWRHPDERAAVRSAVLKVANPELEKAQAYRQAFQATILKFPWNQLRQEITTAAQVNRDLQDLLGKAQRLAQTAAVAAITAEMQEAATRVGRALSQAF